MEAIETPQKRATRKDATPDPDKPPDMQPAPRKLTTNAPVPSVLEAYAKETGLWEAVLFAVVGDLTLESRYGESGLLFLPDRLLTAGGGTDTEPQMILYADLTGAAVRRLYGNALFRVDFAQGGTKTLLRFTYAAAEIAEAAARFLCAVCENGYDAAQLEPVQASFDSRRARCPKCGRRLRTPDSPCVNCAGKGRAFSKFLPYVKPHLPRLGMSLALSIVNTGLDLIPGYITGKVMVDKVLPSGDLPMLVKTILFLLGAYACAWSIGCFNKYQLRITGNRIIVALKSDIYAKAQYLPMKFYDKTTTGAVINRVNGDTSVLQQFILRVTQEAVVKILLLIGLMIIMFAMNWRLALVSLSPVPLVVFGTRIFGKKIAPKYRRIWRRNSAIYSLLADTIPGVRVIKAFTNEDSAIRKFKQYLDDWYKEDRAAGRIGTVFSHVTGFMVTCGSIIIWAVGGGQIIAAQGGSNTATAMTIGTLVTFISFAAQFYGPINFMAEFNDTYQNASASVEKLLDILEAEPEHDFGKGEESPAIAGRIEFRNVNFAFDRSKKVLNDVNFIVEPGDIVGIVGTTGSGKSTLINLIMRYYDDYEGDILIDGCNLREIDMSAYRSRIGFVQQEPLMFKDTIFNNIAYGAQPHVEQVLYAAEIANAHGFIARLPDAYDTVLGERGVGLSGGEKQRVSIARAVLKNPSILIFDEATAAVDSETEHLIQEAIERLIRGRTTLMIAHRLSTLRKANKIIVVDKGKILEFGTPAELLEKKGKYWKLVQIQSMAETAEKQRKAENFE